MLPNNMPNNTPNNLLDKVKEFLIRLVKDSVFIAQLQQRSAEQLPAFLQDAGYGFSQDEFESATLQILDLKEQNQFHELSEAELVGAVGGWFRLYPKYPGWFSKPPRRLPRPIGGPIGGPIDGPIGGPIAQPMYGVVIEPPSDGSAPYPVPWSKPLPTPMPQPMYGVVIDQPHLYGADS